MAIPAIRKAGACNLYFGQPCAQVRNEGSITTEREMNTRGQLAVPVQYPFIFPFTLSSQLKFSSISVSYVDNK